MANFFPTKGMRDFLPQELAARQTVLDTIRQCYQRCGFLQIETPCVEDLALLCSNQGGENEKLIYKILKRGEKLKSSQNDDLCDLALRYDLTVPLSRYYSCHNAKLPSVFKAIQIGNVWRAERQQKGRYRQFVQCDIDIINQPSTLAELEIINATAFTLTQLGVKDFVVRINDRRLLSAFAAHCGVSDCYDKVCIVLDKLDKIGLEGVEKELNTFLDIQQTARVMQTLSSLDPYDLSSVVGVLADSVDSTVVTQLQKLMDMCKQTMCSGDIKFDFTLVRGMGYYTGTIYEVEVQGAHGSVGGGGRYDNLIGRFSGKNVAACGFSIGFERILMLLEQRNLIQKSSVEKLVFVLDSNVTDDVVTQIMQRANQLRSQGKQVQIQTKRNNFHLQITQIKQENANEILLVQQDGQVRTVE